MKKQAPWWEQILRGQRNDMLARSIRRVAKLSSKGYGAGIRGREIAYERGWLKVKRLPQPTICVGNITVGGTGKTPLVIRLVSDLLERGMKPAVLLRGYKREKSSRVPLLVRDAKKIRAKVAEAGDEAMELAVRLPGACVGVGTDRYAVGQALLKNHEIDCFVLDDGFQHHRLDRDINIVTIDALDPWGGGQLLPAGLLREPPEALRRADAVVITRSGSVAPDRLSVLRAEVSHFLQPSSGLLESLHVPRELISLPTHKTATLRSLAGKKILAVSGIGNPQGFEATLTEAGAKIQRSLRLPDHGGKAEKLWEWVRAQPTGYQWIVMTEKDASRWAAEKVPAAFAGKVMALRMDLDFTSGQQHWKALLELIKKLSHGR